MVKRKFLCIALIVLSTSISYGNMNEDIAFLNELYKQEKYEMAEQESKKFIINYPESKYNKNICERLAKIYFMKKNYPESEKYFLDYLNNYKLRKKEKQEASAYLYTIDMILDRPLEAEKLKEEFIKNKELYGKTIYNSGIALLNNEKNVEAIKEFTKSINLKNTYYEPSILYLAMALYNNNQYNDTIKYLNIYNNLEAKEKDIPLMLYLYGSTYYKLNDLNKAIQYLALGATKYPNNSYIEKGKVTLVEIYMNRREIDKALVVYSSIQNRRTKNLGAKILGDYFLSRDEYRRAIDFYNVIGEDKSDGEIYTYAYANYKLGNYKKAEKEFKKIKEQKYTLDTRYYTILTLYNMKDYKEVISYEKYLDEYSGDKYIDLEIALGNSYYELKDDEKAYRYYKDIYAKDPSLPNLYRMIILETDVDDEKNLDLCFEKYKEKFYDDDEYRKNIYLAVGNYYYKKGRVEDSIITYKEYMKERKDTEIGNNLITILVNEKKYKEVIKYLDLLDKTDDNLYLKGIAYMGIGKYNEANDIFTTLKNKENVGKDLKEKISYNIIKNDFLWEKYQKVIEEGNYYLESSYLYGLPEIVDRMGLSYYRMGNFEKAREIFNKLLVIEESKDYAEFQIAETYYAENNFKKAKEIYKLSYKENNKSKYKEEAKYWELNCDLNLEDYNSYMESSERFLKEFPESSYRETITATRGEILVRRGNEEEAIKEYKNLYEITKEANVKDGIVEKIILLYREIGKDEEKNNWIDKFSDKYKKSYYKSISYRKKGMKKEAREEEKILFESKEYKDYAILNLAEDNYSNKNYDKAENEYKKIREMESSLYKDLVIFRLGELSFIKEKYEDAITDFSKLIMLYPSSDYVVPAKLKLSDSYYQAKKIDKAKKGYEELLNDKSAVEYKEYILERLLFISLEEDDKIVAEKYYKKLKELNPNVANKYDEFFIVEEQENLNKNNEGIENKEAE